MIAVVILAAGTFALVEVTSRCLAVVTQAKHFQMARTVLDEGELEHPILRKDTEIRNMTVEPVTYEKDYTFERTAEETDDEGLMLLRTTVTWTRKGKEAREEVVTYLYTTNKFRSTR
jgi:hypothetical protein